MANEPELTQVERDKLTINPDFDFRKVARRGLESLSAAEVAMFKWSGIYAQPQAGFFTVRVVVPGGWVTTPQLRRLADLAERHARDGFCITTRQDVQFHWVRLDDLHKIIEGVAEVGLTTKNGCGDVLRNVVASPLADTIPQEVAPVRETVLRLASDPELRDAQRNLPRKHKISVACANEPEAQTLINCQGWVPLRRDGELGWRFHAGGGLGARPCFAKVVFDWVPDALVLPVAQATVEAFRLHGDRRQRTMARLKVVVERMGPVAFAGVVLDILRERGVAGIEGIEVARTATPEIGEPLLCGQEALPQRQPGLNAVRVLVPRSELTSAQARGLADLADLHGSGRVSFTNRQNLQLRDVPDARMAALLGALHAAGFRTQGHEHLPDIVACVGTTLCKWGLADAPATFRSLQAAFADDETYWRAIGPLRINITGCPNNCAQSSVADIGLRGRRSRGPDGEPVEGYVLLVGGRLSGAGRLAEPLCEVPSKDVVPAVRRILDTYLRHRTDASERFGTFCERVGVDGLRDWMSAG